MKTFLSLLLSIAVVTAAPASESGQKRPDEKRLQRIILSEIIQDVNLLNATLNDTLKKTLVQQVLVSEHCSVENFCKAGKVLDTFKAKQLGLNEKNWCLPRRLVAYSRDIHCRNPSPEEKIELQDLLNAIRTCAQREYSKH